MLYIICYDIACDRRRKKLADLLLDHGDRIQESAFECDLRDDRTVERLLARAARLVDPAADTVRCYRICAACVGAGVRLGKDRRPQKGAALVLG